MNTVIMRPLQLRLKAMFRFVWVTLAYVLVSTAVLHAFMRKWAFRGDASFGLEALLNHTTYKPYAYRLLSPEIIKTISDIVPQTLLTRLEQFLSTDSSLLVYRRPDESWNLIKSLHFHVSYGYLFASLMVILFVARRLTHSVLRPSQLFNDLAPVIALLFLPLSFHLGGYLYDFAELALLLLSVVCILEKHFIMFYIVFVCAILNKESNVLITSFFVTLLLRDISNKTLYIHMIVQIAISTFLLLAVRYYFRDLSGGGVEFHLWENMHFWLSPGAYLGVIEGYAPLIPLPQGLHVVNFFLIITIVSYALGQVPVNIRRFFWASVIINIPLMLLFGYLDEIRNLSLCFPAFYLIGCYGIVNIYSMGSSNALN